MTPLLVGAAILVLLLLATQAGRIIVFALIIIVAVKSCPPDSPSSSATIAQAEAPPPAPQPVQAAPAPPPNGTQETLYGYTPDNGNNVFGFKTREDARKDCIAHRVSYCDSSTWHYDVPLQTQTPRERTDEQIIKELLTPNLTPLN